MKKNARKMIRRLLSERIQQISAVRNPKDSKYPLTITADVSPTNYSNINKSHPLYQDLLNVMRNGNVPHLLRKKITFQGDYSKSGSTGVKTLRLKISRNDWPDIWSFPETEIERRLFLQNFRIQNLDMISPFDEGGEEFKKLFPPDPVPDPDIDVQVEFEESEEESEESSESSSQDEVNPQAKKIEILEAFRYVIDDARENNEIEYSNMLNDAMMAFMRDIIKR
jgi:hypothetical protein